MPDVSVPAPLPPVEAPAPLPVPGGHEPDGTDGSGGIRSEKADLAPAPWWTSFAQSPLELTPEEIVAADLLAGRTPPPAPEPTPLPAPVSARSRLRARLAASLSVPTSVAGQTSAPAAAAPAADTHSHTRLAETAAQASAATRISAAPTGAPVASPVAAPPAQPAAARLAAAGAAAAESAATHASASVDPRSPEPAPAPTVATAPAGARAAAPLASSGTTGAAGTAAPRSAFGTNASSGTNAPVAASGPRASAGASSGSGAGRPASAGRPPGGTRPGKPRLLVWITGGLVLVLALAALFFLGQSLVGGDPAPVAVATTSATPAPSATPSAAPSAPAEATGPQPVGEHQWDTLFGGECLQPYVSPWEEEFTVADCATPHAAQLVYRGLFAGDAATAFPGEAELAGQINLLCSAPGVIDLAAASAYDDVQVQGSYPITEEQWFEGARYYYCFVSRSSGEPLTASVAGPGPEPAA